MIGRVEQLGSGNCNRHPAGRSPRRNRCGNPGCGEGGAAPCREAGEVFRGGGAADRAVEVEEAADYVLADGARVDPPAVVGELRAVEAFRVKRCDGDDAL